MYGDNDQSLIDIQRVALGLMIGTMMISRTL